MGRPADLKISESARSSWCIAGLLSGLVSLYFGLYGRSTALTAVSAVSGTLSLFFAVIPAICGTADGKDSKSLVESGTLLSERDTNSSGGSVSLPPYESVVAGETIMQRIRNLGTTRRTIEDRLRKVMCPVRRRVFSGDKGDDSLPTQRRTTLPPAYEARSLSISRRIVRVREGRRRNISLEDLRAIFGDARVQLEAFRNNGADSNSHFPSPWRDLALRVPLGSSVARTTTRPLDIVAGVAAAVQYLHSFEPPLIHGDIRATNIGVDPAHHVVVLNLPIERWEHGASTTYHLRHDDIARHLPPEVIRAALDSRGNSLRPSTGTPWSEALSKATDIYSLSITIIELLTGSPPFTEPRLADFGEVRVLEISKMLAAVVAGARPRIVFEDVAPLFQSSPNAPTPTPVSARTHLIVSAVTSLVRQLEFMWAQDPAMRPSADQVAERFEELARFEEVL